MLEAADVRLDARLIQDSSPSAPTFVTPANVTYHARLYPFAVRQSMRCASFLRKGRIDVTMPDGRTFRFGGTTPGSTAVIHVRDLAFAKRLMKRGDLGVADAYIEGEWDSPDLPAVTRLFADNGDLIDLMLAGSPFVRILQNFRNWMNSNTKSGSRRNIRAHYDLGNAFYSTWLDSTMTYSAAMFENANESDLVAGQTRKYRELAQSTGLAEDHHVLEIGCGWGGFAEFAARDIGCQVTALTISQEQYNFASKRIFEAGLAEKVTIKLADYRDERGAFDRIASIEMFEAVGEKYWPIYFQQLNDRLRPGGVAGLQVITIRDDLFQNYKRQPDFIRSYIFPGGMLPAPDILRRLGETFGMKLEAERIFGHDYAATLAQWATRFRAAWPQIAAMGFNEQFRRLWDYYLAYCEGGFRAGSIDVRQMVFAKSA